MKEFKNIPIFQYGMNPNGYYISKEVVEKAVETFKNAPVIDYREDYNGAPIGIVKDVVNIENDFVYADVLMMGDIEVGDFYNYEIHVDKYHQEDRIAVIDDFKLMGVSLEIKSE
jgi:hypothetical protein